MNNQIKRMLVNSGYAIFSNLLSMLVSALVVLVLPKLIGVKSYGYWQLYLFYVSYVGFFHLGWIDGIYLKFGGAHYDELDREKFFSQFMMYAFFQAIVAFLIYGYGLLFVSGADKKFIFNMLAITLLLTNLRYFVIYILQTTNRIKHSSIITILDRLVYALLLLMLVFGGVKNYHIMIYVDILARLVSLLYGIYLCKSVIIHSLHAFQFDILEVLDNIKVGSSLMLSNIASLLIIGTVRLGIERRWDIATFGKVSLTLSISNLMMTFINAVGVVIFPMLRRLEQSKLPSLYLALRNVLMAMMLAILIFYYPLKMILNIWLPSYRESIIYMALVFPMAIYEGKMSLLINTYLKALRMEKYILKVNVMTVGLSAILTVLTTILLGNLQLSIVSIVVLLAARCILAETTVARTLKINVSKDILLELFLTMVFIVSGWFLDSVYAVIIYLITYLFYLLVKRAEIMQSIRNTKKMLAK